MTSTSAGGSTSRGGVGAVAGGGATAACGEGAAAAWAMARVPIAAGPAGAALFRKLRRSKDIESPFTRPRPVRLKADTTYGYFGGGAPRPAGGAAPRPPAGAAPRPSAGGAPRPPAGAAAGGPPQNCLHGGG